MKKTILLFSVSLLMILGACKKDVKQVESSEQIDFSINGTWLSAGNQTRIIYDQNGKEIKKEVIDPTNLQTNDGDGSFVNMEFTLDNKVISRHKIYDPQTKTLKNDGYNRDLYKLTHKSGNEYTLTISDDVDYMVEQLTQNRDRSIALAGNDTEAKAKIMADYNMRIQELRNEIRTPTDVELTVITKDKFKIVQKFKKDNDEYRSLEDGQSGSIEWSLKRAQ